MAVISPELVKDMQKDRDAGMDLLDIAGKYGVSKSSVVNHTVGAKRLKISEELQKAMQADRDSGMSVNRIATKHGVSELSVTKYTIYRKSNYAAPVGAAKNPITAAELEAYRAGLRVGGQLDLQVMQYDEAGIQTGLKRERCQIEHVSRHVVVFRRPNGRTEHRTIVELCQAGRKV